MLSLNIPHSYQRLNAFTEYLILNIFSFTSILTRGWISAFIDLGSKTSKAFLSGVFFMIKILLKRMPVYPDFPGCLEISESNQDNSLFFTFTVTDDSLIDQLY